MIQEIIVCYRQKSELMNLAKIINQIIPRLVQDKIELEFFQLKINPNGIKNYLIYVNSILEIMLQYSNNRCIIGFITISIFYRFIDNSLKRSI